MSARKERKQARRERKASLASYREAAKEARLERRARGEGFFGPKGQFKNLLGAATSAFTGDSNAAALVMDKEQELLGINQAQAEIEGRNIPQLQTAGIGGMMQSGIGKIAVIGILGFVIYKLFSNKGNDRRYR